MACILNFSFDPHVRRSKHGTDSTAIRLVGIALQGSLSLHTVGAYFAKRDEAEHTCSGKPSRFSVAICQCSNMQGTFPLKVPNHLQTPLHWKLLTQGSSLLVEKLERNTNVCEARHFGLKGALASASS